MLAVAPSRSNDHSVGVLSGETSLHESPPVPMMTMDSLASFPAVGDAGSMSEPITTPASSTAAVAAASSRRRVVTVSLRSGSSPFRRGPDLHQRRHGKKQADAPADPPDGGQPRPPEQG